MGQMTKIDMTPQTLDQYREQAQDANNSAWVLAINKFITEIQRLQVLLAWEAGELSEIRAVRMLKQYGRLEGGVLEARELKREAIEAGKELVWPKPLEVKK